MEKLEHYRKEIKNKSAPHTLTWCLKTFGPSRVILASSFSAEDQVLTDILSRTGEDFRVFTLDTGRLFQET